MSVAAGGALGELAMADMVETLRARAEAAAARLEARRARARLQEGGGLFGKPAACRPLLGAGTEEGAAARPPLATLSGANGRSRGAEASSAGQENSENSSVQGSPTHEEDDAALSRSAARHDEAASLLPLTTPGREAAERLLEDSLAGVDARARVTAAAHAARRAARQERLRRALGVSTSSSAQARVQAHAPPPSQAQPTTMLVPPPPPPRARALPEVGPLSPQHRRPPNSPMLPSGAAAALETAQDTPARLKALASRVARLRRRFGVEVSPSQQWALAGLPAMPSPPPKSVMLSPIYAAACGALSLPAVAAFGSPLEAALRPGSAPVAAAEAAAAAAAVSPAVAAARAALWASDAAAAEDAHRASQRAASALCGRHTPQALARGLPAYQRRAGTAELNVPQALARPPQVPVRETAASRARARATTAPEQLSAVERRLRRQTLQRLRSRRASTAATGAWPPRCATAQRTVPRTRPREPLLNRHGHAAEVAAPPRAATMPGEQRRGSAVAVTQSTLHPVSPPHSTRDPLSSPLSQSSAANGSATKNDTREGARQQAARLVGEVQHRIEAAAARLHAPFSGAQVRRHLGLGACAVPAEDE